MIILNLEQGTPEWEQARVGIATASNFAKIITPGGEKSAQWEAYAHEILAEEIVGKPIEGYKNAAMEEGNRREAESVAYYEMKQDVTTEAVGFIMNDARTLGCSPDRLVGKDGLFEAKNPEAHTHVGYLIDGKLGKKYWPQLQGQLYISRRQWVDAMSYFPEMPEKILRVDRDEKYIATMAVMLADFIEKLAVKRKKLVDMGYLSKDRPAFDVGKYLGAG